MDQEKFNQNKYIQNWKKLHKKQFKVELNISEYEELKNLLKENNLSNVQFVRNALNELKKKK